MTVRQDSRTTLPFRSTRSRGGSFKHRLGERARWRLCPQVLVFGGRSHAGQSLWGRRYAREDGTGGPRVQCPNRWRRSHCPRHPQSRLRRGSHRAVLGPVGGHQRAEVARVDWALLMFFHRKATLKYSRPFEAL
jgi:hypothetical protein